MTHAPTSPVTLEIMPTGPLALVQTTPPILK